MLSPLATMFLNVFILAENVKWRFPWPSARGRCGLGSARDHSAGAAYAPKALLARDPRACSSVIDRAHIRRGFESRARYHYYERLEELVFIVQQQERAFERMRFMACG